MIMNKMYVKWLSVLDQEASHIQQVRVVGNAQYAITVGSFIAQIKSISKAKAHLREKK